jgi:hypothetical protein
MRKKLFCVLMTLSIVLSCGVAYAAEPGIQVDFEEGPSAD